MSGKIRVVVVDDSAFMRTAVARTLDTDDRIEVVGQARDGQEAVEVVKKLAPDAVTMDFNMPRMNGAQAIRAIFADKPVPIIMLSAHTMAGAKETVEALSAGAVDFITKPDGEVSTDLSGIRELLIGKVVSAASSRPRRSEPAPEALDIHSRLTPDVSSPVADAEPRRERISFASMVLDPAVIVAISTGGPAALEQVVPRLPPTFDKGMLIVQHMPAQFTRALAERLSSLSSLDVREMRAGDRMTAGTVFIAPGDQHVVIERNGMARMTDSPPVNGCRPSADVTLQTAAPVYGPKLTAVVMTGMGRDGALGAQAVKAAGGRVLAQDQETSVVYGMPRAVVEMRVVDEVLPLGQIAGRLGSRR